MKSKPECQDVIQKVKANKEYGTAEIRTIKNSKFSNPCLPTGRHIQYFYTEEFEVLPFKRTYLFTLTFSPPL